MVVPWWAAPVAVVFAVVASGSCAVTMPVAATEVTPAGVRFALLRPEGRSVAVAGSFNQWSAVSHPLGRNGSRGEWTVVVPLPPGEHLFMYFVDGAWVSPPYAEDYADDGFGARNGVVVVRP